MSKLDQAKFNAKFVMEFPLYRCRNCDSLVQAQRMGEFVSCDCFSNKEDTQGFYYDPLYMDDKGSLIMRRGGNIDNMKEIPK